MTVGINAPFGLRPIMSSVGGGWDGRTTDYSIDAPLSGVGTDGQSLFIGDPVQAVRNLTDYNPAQAGINRNAKKNLITQYGPGYVDGTPAEFAKTPVVGVFQGCIYQSTQSMVNNVVNYPIWPGGTQVVPGTTPIAKIIDDFTVIYEIQISTSIAANANAFVAKPFFPVINTANTNRSGIFGSNFALNIGGGGNFQTVTDAWTTLTSQTYANNPTTGNPITFQSGFYMDISTVTGAGATHDYSKEEATLPLKLIGYSDSVEALAATPLTLDATPFLTMKVRLNNHLYSAGTVGTIALPIAP